MSLNRCCHRSSPDPNVAKLNPNTDLKCANPNVDGAANPVEKHR